LPHDERYLAAEEYMDIVYQLWEKSWDDGAQKWQVEPEMAFDPDKVHTVVYEGKYHKFSGHGPSHPSPQRTPFIFQAGASKAGIDFGGKHAEAIFCAYTSIEECKKYTEKIRAVTAAYGRDPQSVKFYLGAMLFIAPTEEEAKAKYEAARKLVSIEGGLARFSGLGNIDMSVYPIDEPFKFTGNLKENAIHSFIENMQEHLGRRTEEVTPRDLGELLAFGGLGPRPVGTPAQVADELEKWLMEGDVDGFNLSRKSYFYNEI
jgi:alkanesulfonate monooxygenase SsuD/methylene tetrahydromethanopterin reductase-like flavin-dependent oxidoreductase (luciferase family)